MTRASPGAEIAGTRGLQRLAYTTLAVVALMTVSLLVYHHGWRYAGPAVHRPVGHVAGAIGFVCIGFASLLIYPLGRASGVRPARVVTACLLVPVIWDLKEMWRVTDFFTLGEALWWGLNTAFLLALFGGLGEMGLCEIAYRLWQRKRGHGSARVLTPLPVFAVALAVVALYTLVIWDGGVHAFYIYMEGYRVLFH